MEHTMESFSVSIHRGLVHWQGLLLTVSLINFWCLPTAGRLTVTPINAEEGEDVQLGILNMPPNITGVTWYRGKGTNKNCTIAFLTANSGMHVTGSSHGHVMLNVNGSLLIKNVTKNDRGWYTIVVHLENSEEHTGWGQLIVYEPLRVPTIIASSTTVTENKDAVELTCYTNLFFTQWLFNGRNVEPSERIQMSQAQSQQILVIDPVRREDAGTYQCQVFNPVGSAKSAPFELTVKFE